MAGEGGDAAHAGEMSTMGGSAGAGESGTDAGAGEAGTGSADHGGEAGAAGESTAGSAGGSGAGGTDEHRTGTVAAAYQINAAHTGAQPRDRLRLPLERRWSHDFGETGLSYPLIADDHVFVTVRSHLYALARDTGEIAWGPVDLGGTDGWSNAAYGRGHVIAVSDGGAIGAFDSRTGVAAWQTTLPGSGSVHSAPVIFDGRLYTSRMDGRLYASSIEDGSEVWRYAVENGWQSSPAVSEAGVFACYLCSNTYGIHVETGARLWYNLGTCTGGGAGTTAVLADGRLYTRGPAGNWVLDAATGERLELFAAGPAPALSDGILYAVNDGILAATPVGKTSALWRFGDGSITTAPIVVGSTIIVGTVSGQLFAVDRTSGHVKSQDQLSASIAPSNEKATDAPLTGLAAADGLLAVPAGTELVAY
jgi:outer membrane protein assembly factor BamB